MITLETKRLLLRPFKDTDLNDFYEYAKVEGVGEAAGWKHHQSIKESEHFLSIFMKNPYDFAIEHKADQKMIGSIGFKEAKLDEFDSQFKQLEIGYVLSKDYWNQGLMSEAVSKVIEYAFNLGSGPEITPEHLPPPLCEETADSGKVETLKGAVAAVEKELIIKALNICGRDTDGKLKAAERLGIGKTTLYNKINKYKI